MKTQLDSGLQLRSPEKGEAQKAEALFNNYDMFITGEKNSTAKTIAETWNFPHFSLQEDARVIVNEKGEWLAYASLWNDSAPFVRNFVNLKTEPSCMGTETEMVLIKWAEEKARSNISKAPKDAEVFMNYKFNEGQKETIAGFGKLGFSPIRYFWRMGIDLENIDGQLDKPEGISISTHMEKNNLMDIINCDRDSFEDHWGYIKSPIEEEYREWEHWIKTAPYYDPSFWFIAYSGDRIAGLTLCFNGMVNDKNIGYLDSVCVRKEFRKKGIASYLLNYSFQKLKQAGRTKAYLHVDSDSLTGATRLYESVGMKANQSSILMEKVLRKGKSYRTEKV